MASVTPPSSYVPPQGSAQSPPVDGEVVEVPVKTLPPSLQDTPRDLSLRGTVQGTNPDGTTRINTPRGPVDVQLPQPLPAKGTEVQVDIPAGSPPRTASVTLPPAPPPTQVSIPDTIELPNSAGTSLPPVQTTPNPGAPQTQTETQTPAGTPLPTQTPLPAAQTPAPLPSAVVMLQENAQNPQQLSPQGLLDFLKTSLQTFLKTPALPQQQVANTFGLPNVDMPNLAGQAQRPLQIGQWVRLTPLPAGQWIGTPAVDGASTPLTTPRINAPVPGMQTQNPAATLNVVAPNVQPAQTGAAVTSLQNLIRTIIQSVTLAPPTGAGAATVPVPGMSAGIVPPLLTPNLSAPQIQIPGAPVPIGTPVLPGQTPEILTAPQAQLIITAPAGQTASMPIPQALDVRVSALLPTASPQILQNPNVANLLHGTPGAPTLFAQVTGQTAQGLPVVELPTFTIGPDGTPKPSSMLMVLQFPARGLAPATVMKLDLLPGMQSPALTASTAATTAQSMTWETLDDVLHNLSLQPQGQTAQAALIAALPKPGSAAFTAPVLMFVAALRGGDITAWMGEKGIDAVRTSRRADAIARLSSDFTSASRQLMADDAKPAGEWKSLNLPMLYGGELNRVQLHYKSFERESEDGNITNKKSGTRFIMDLALTRMGAMQIDGFSVDKKLDITLRSEQALSAPMRESMRARYHEAVSGIGFSGELNFNASPDRKGWVDLDDHGRGSAVA